MSYRRYYTPQRATSERHSHSLDAGLQLERDRVANDLKLKNRFEHIFAKYARDFSNVGDEIDMETGEIVVDNGHVAFMQNERDVGSSASSQFVAAFAEELEEEDAEGAGEEDGDLRDKSKAGQVDQEEDEEEIMEHQGSEDEHAQGEGEEEEEDELADDEEDELSIGHTASQRTSVARTSSPSACPVASNNAHVSIINVDEDMIYNTRSPAHASPHALAQDEQAARSLPRGVSLSDSNSSSDQDLASNEQSIIPSTETPHHLPQISIESSLSALVPHQDASGRIDPAAIQDLGMSIANQIADFLTRATSGRLDPRPHASRDPWSVPPLPKDAFGPARAIEDRHAATPVSRRYPSVMESPGASSLWAPAPVSRRDRPSKRRKSHHHNIDPLLMQGAESDDSSSSEGIAPGVHQPMRAKAYRKFRKDEDDLLKRLRDVDGMSWHQMSTYFPERTPIALQSRYARALRHLPRPVMVKREIVEIVDGEDDGQSEHTPSWRVLPALPDQTPRRPVEAPLLRQALGGALDGRESSPVAVPDEDDDAEPSPTYPYYSNTPPPGYGYAPPGYYFPGGPPYQSAYGAYPPPNGMWYPEGAQPVPRGTKRRKWKYQNKKEAHPRYTRFDTTQGAGSFGILRAERPQMMVATPQQHLIGPRTEATGSFGVLKMDKPKPPKVSKLERVMKKARQHAAELREGSRGQSGSEADEVTPDPPIHAFAMRRFSNASLDDQHHLQVPEGGSEALGDSPYPETGKSNADNGPYFLANLPQPLDQSPTTVRHIMESSPALPTPPSDGSLKSSHAPPAVSAGIAPVAQMSMHRSDDTPQLTASRESPSAYKSPAAPLPEPLSATKRSRGPDMGVVRVQARPAQDDSEDELA